MAKRIGKSTIQLDNRVSIVGCGTAVGKKEGEGPLAEHYDNIYEDTKMGLSSWEAAESAFLNSAVTSAISKSGLNNIDIDILLCGDLLDQSIASTFGVKDYNFQHIGLFGACSTKGLSLALASLIVDCGAANNAIAAACSHFCSAERQFRFPLEYGGKRTPTSQWTVTGAGASVLSGSGNGPYIKNVVFGRIVDFDVKDANNMGAAMAPAARDTIKSFFEDTNTKPDDYDGIFTGDLGLIGSELMNTLLEEDGYKLNNNYNDCGLMIYDMDDSDVIAGGSGCGCSASVLCGYIIPKLKMGELKNILFCATGALMSPTSSQQGLSIPGIAHAVNIVSKL